jgi:error-prone DNA polymerase
MGTEYVELHCHSYFSLLEGASSPEALAARAAGLGYPALALTDRDGLYGAVRFWRAAREQGVKPIVGAEVTLANGGHLTLLAESQTGYANLCRLLSAGQLAGGKGQPHLTLETIASHAGGLICLCGGHQGAVAAALLVGDERGARQAVETLRDIFGPEHLRIEVQRHALPGDGRLAAGLVALARRLDVDVVVTNDVHYAERSGQRLHDVLTCIRHHTTLPEALLGGLLHPNSDRFLKTPAEMAALFADLPEALRNTLSIAERCQVSLDFSARRLPAFPAPEGHTSESYLRLLCEEGLRRKFDPVTPQAAAQLAHELGVIGRAGLAGYFLVVWDIVRFARSRGLRCQGRGSAANSLAAYVLDITPVDPLRHHLLFERFLSDEAHTMPDIDVDFAADRREEVVQYVYERYGEEHVGMVCNVVTYRARSALRDAAKALAFPPDVIDRAAKALDTHSAGAAARSIAESLPEPEPGAAPLPWQTLSEVLGEIEGVPRHLSIHVGGMLITAAPLVEVVPLERAAMPGRVVVQWDKDSVEDAGLIKIDLLGLRTLGAIEEALGHIREGQDLTPSAGSGQSLDLDHLPLDDPAVYAMLRRADTVGCFQVESRAQAQIQPLMQPGCFEDIVVEIALIRPGPLQGNMVHPYLRRRQGREPVVYPHPDLEPALAETLGVIVFQEQCIRVAMAIAGFSPAEADRLRRAKSRSRSQEAMAALRERFLAGAQANGVDEATAGEVFEQLEAFAGFGFCKSHAAAFALIAYQTLYLKAHFPAALTCALLNQQPMGFYSPEVIVGDARRHGVAVLPPDVNRSRVECSLEMGDDSSLAVRLGLRYVHGLGEAWPARVVERRGDRPYRDLPDFCRRARLPRPAVENLIRAGAADSLSERQSNARRDLLWQLGGLTYPEEGLDIETSVEAVALPHLSPAERMGWEYELLGLAPGEHVMALYREALRAQGILSSREFAEQENGQAVRIAGLVIVIQRPPSARNFAFATLEDETNLMNVILRPAVYTRYRDTLRTAPLLVIEGVVQRQDGVINLLADRVAPLSAVVRVPIPEA